MTIILGIDPGLEHTGWGVIRQQGNGLSFIAGGVITTKPADEIAHRLSVLHQDLTKIISQYQPDEAAVEETFINTNARSSLKLGYARGAILLTLSLAGLQPKEYAATQVKKSLVGAGRAEKGQVAMMVKRLLPTAEFTASDTADALAVAICHAHHAATMRRLIA